MTYNPNNPLVLGVEWYPWLASGTPIAATGFADAELLTAVATETVDGLLPYVASVVQPGRYLMEVYPAGGQTCPATSTATYRPSADYENISPFAVGFWQNQGGTSATGTLYQSIDEASVNLADYLEATSSDFGAVYGCNVASGAFPAGDRVAAIRIMVGLASFGGQVIQVGITDGVTSWAFPVFSYFGAFQVYTFTLPQTNPLTGQPWTGADVAAFAGGTAITVQHGSFNANPSQVVQLWVEVDHAADNREAYGAAWVSATGYATTFPMTQPDGTPGWDAVSGSSYELSLRRLDDPAYGAVGSIAWRWLQAPSACPHTLHRGRTWLVDANGCYIPDTQVNQEAQAHAVLLAVGAGYSASSQPYALITPGRVDTATNLDQELDGAEAADYGRVRAQVRPGAACTEQLVVGVYRRSDDAPMGSPATLTVDAWNALTPGGDGWGLLDVQLDTHADLVAATQYYLRFSSSAGTGSTDGWEVAVLDTDGLAGSATYGGTTDRATVDAVESDSQDVAATLAEMPYPPSMPSATPTYVPVADNGTECPIVQVGYMLLGWAPSSLGADFGATIIERSTTDPDGPTGATWLQIAALADEATTTYADWEAPLGVPAWYQWRLERADGTASGPSAAVQATLYATDCEVVFTTNEAPELTVASVHLGVRTWQFLGADEVDLRAVYGRDYVVALAPTEKGPDRFQLQLLLSATLATPIGRAVFDPLLALCTDPTLAYICVKDEVGRTWLATVQHPEATRAEPGHFHNGVVVVTQVTGVPTIATVTNAVQPDTTLRTGSARLIDSTDVATGFSATTGSYTPKPGGGDPWDPYTNGYKYLVSVPGLADIEVYVAFKVHTGSGAGVMCFLGGEYGTNWWSTRDDDNELWLQTDVRDKGYDVLQVQWQTADGSLDGWIGARIGERTGLHQLSARVAALLRQLYADFVDPGTWHNGANHFAVSAQSAGGGGLDDCLTLYGLGDIVQVASNTGAMPFAAFELLARGDDQYAAGTGALQIIDALRGYEPDGLGPAQLREPSVGWWAWVADDVCAGDTANDWPSGTRSFFLFGEDDDSGSAPAGHDLVAKLRTAQPSVDFPRIAVPAQGHQLDTRGLRILGPAMRGEPYQLWTGGRNLGGTRDHIDLNFGRNDTALSGAIAHQALVPEGAVLIGACSAATVPGSMTTSLPGWTVVTFQIGAGRTCQIAWKVADSADEAAAATTGGLVITFSVSGPSVTMETAGGILWVPPGHNSVQDLNYTEPEAGPTTAFTLGSIGPPTPATAKELLVGVVATDAAADFHKPPNPWEDDYRGTALLLITKSVAAVAGQSAALVFGNSVTAEGRLLSFSAP